MDSLTNKTPSRETTEELNAISEEKDTLKKSTINSLLERLGENVEYRKLLGRLENREFRKNFEKDNPEALSILEKSYARKLFLYIAYNNPTYLFKVWPKLKGQSWSKEVFKKAVKSDNIAYVFHAPSEFHESIKGITLEEFVTKESFLPESEEFFPDMIKNLAGEDPKIVIEYFKNKSPEEREKHKKDIAKSVKTLGTVPSFIGRPAYILASYEDLKEYNDPKIEKIINKLIKRFVKDSEKEIIEGVLNDPNFPVNWMNRMMAAVVIKPENNIFPEEIRERIREEYNKTRKK